MQKDKLIIIIVSIILIIGAFFGGMYYKGSSSNNFSQGMANFQNGQGRMNSNFKGMGGQTSSMSMVRGEVVSADSTSVTIKTESEGSKIVMLSSDTEIVETTLAKTTDLTQGKTIMVTGKTNSDGTIAADSIRLGDLNMRRPDQNSNSTGTASDTTKSQTSN